MNGYDVVLSARSNTRLCASQYINGIVKGFLEFHGDRRYGDDSAVIGGIGMIGDMPVTVIGIEKGNSTNERIRHNFGSAHPEGYRKALRLMKQAEKFHRPVLCFVDTAGAFCGVEAEERGQGLAIAENLYEMSTLRTPILSIVIGEGGSGGALALSHADKIWMVEGSYFSVVSPENCANILWKRTETAPEAAEALKLTAGELKKMNLIDKICDALKEEASEKERKSYMKELERLIKNEFHQLMAKPEEVLLKERYQKFRNIGY